MSGTATGAQIVPGSGIQPIGFLVPPSEVGTANVALYDGVTNVGVTAILRAHHADLNQEVFLSVESVREINPELAVTDQKIAAIAKAIKAARGSLGAYGSTLQSLMAQSRITLAECRILGFRDPQRNNRLTPIDRPLRIQENCCLATPTEVQQLFGFRVPEEGLYLGRFQGVDVVLDPEKFLEHFVVLGSTGSGKTYSAGTLVEEFAKFRIPIIVFQPTKPEWEMISQPNQRQDEVAALTHYGLSPHGFEALVYSFDRNWSVTFGGVLAAPNFCLRFSLREAGGRISSSAAALSEIQHLNVELSEYGRQVLVAELDRMNATQSGPPDPWELNDLINSLVAARARPGLTSWQAAGLDRLVEQLRYIDSLGLYRHSTRCLGGPSCPIGCGTAVVQTNVVTDLSQIVQPGRISVIRFLGLSTEETDIAAYLVLSRLRRIKEERLCPNFVMCFEEAQMFTRPERETGTSSGSMLRFFALQGRFFGVGIGLISQKPSLLDPTITSQAHTYILGSMRGEDDLSWTRRTLENVTENITNIVRDQLTSTSKLVFAPEFPMAIVADSRPRESTHGGHTPPLVPPGQSKVRR
jgi:hypothetical protein